MKFLYVGIDALEYSEFDTHIFGDLIDTGTFGVARPEIDHTFPSWTSMNTGLTVNQHKVVPFSYYPEKFGELFNLQFTSEQCIPVTMAHMVYKYIWDYLYDYGYTVGVLNFPVTYPPRRWDRGWFISGYPTSTIQDYKYPEDFNLPFGYTIDWAEIAFMYEHALLETIFKKNVELEAARLQIALNNSKNLDALCVQFPIIDRIGHAFDKTGYDTVYELNAILHVKKLIDILVHEFKPEYVLIASDHGMKRGLHTFNGMWYFSGPNVKKFHKRSVMNYEILPFVLDTMRIPHEYAHVKFENPEITPLTEEDKKWIHDQLKALGYVE